MHSFTALITALPVGLVVTDKTGRIVLTNPALDRLFGYAVGELTGQKVETLIPAHLAGHHPALRAAYLQAPQGRASCAGRDLMAKHRQGHEFPVEVGLTTIDTADGPLVLATIIDVSFHKTYEDALLQANAQLEEFAHLAAHDLRAPLRGIASLLAWIRDALGDAALTPDIARNFDRVQRRVERAERMIGDLLAYAKAERQDEHTERVDPAALIEETLSLLTVPENFTIEVEVAAAPFQAARTPLAMAIRNLLSNALAHHGGPRGKVRVRVHEEGRYNVFTIEDDGAGIPASAKDMIFNHAPRADMPNDGHGMGLAVTRRKVASHGGMIQFDRADTLGGACFRIHWPRIPLPRSA
jgi:two-component system, LuxR family, sensor kinase FixL